MLLAVELLVGDVLTESLLTAMINEGLLPGEARAAVIQSVASSFGGAPAHPTSEQKRVCSAAKRGTDS